MGTPLVTNVGSYDVRTGRWRPSTSAEDLAAQAFREQQRKSSMNDFLKTAVIGGGAVIGGPLLLSALAGAGAAGAAAGSSASAAGAGAGSAAGAASGAAAGAGGWSLGGILGKPATGLAVNALTSYLGQRSANNANKYAINAQATALDKQLAMEQANQAEQRRQFDAQQAAAKAALDAQNQMSARQLAADEADRAYTRSLSEKREAYLDPYRQQSAAARYSLLRMLGMG